MLYARAATIPAPISVCRDLDNIFNKIRQPFRLFSSSCQIKGPHFLLPTDKILLLFETPVGQPPQGWQRGNSLQQLSRERQLEAAPKHSQHLEKTLKISVQATVSFPSQVKLVKRFLGLFFSEQQGYFKISLLLSSFSFF